MKALHSLLLLALCVGIGLAAEPQKPSKTGLVGYKEYVGLLGEEFAGLLQDRNLRAGRFSSTDRPVKLVMDLESTADVRGGSGLPVIQVATGMPVGVLLEANEGKAASYVVFEPICLPVTRRSSPGSPNLERRPAGDRVGIDIQRGTVFVNGHPVTRETRLSDYEGWLAKPDRVTNGKNTIHTYDDLGILLYQRPGENTVLSFTLALAKSDFEFYPKNAFQDGLRIAGQAVGADTPQTALRNLPDVGVRLDPATERMQLPFSMLTNGNVVLTFTYITSPKQLDSVGISWGTRGEPPSNGPAHESQPIRSATNGTSSAALRKQFNSLEQDLQVRVSFGFRPLALGFTPVGPLTLTSRLCPGTCPGSDLTKCP